MKIKTLEGLVVKGNRDTSILDSALRSQVNFEYSCKNGQCGACKTTLLEGEVLMLRSQIALSDTDIEDKKILTCCCAPISDILINAEDLSELKDIEIKTLPARINKIEKKAEKIIEIDLRLPPTANLAFLEGQYFDIIGPQGVRRSYSVASSASSQCLRFWIKEVEGGLLSQYWFNGAKENDLLRIEGPKGSFFFKKPKKDIVFLATGTGIAPIKAILDKLCESPNIVGSANLTLYWGNRESSEFFWEPAYPSLNLQYIPVVSKINEAWIGRTGYIQDCVISDTSDLSDAQIYACGSLNMIESAKMLLVDNGLDLRHFYSDAFVRS